MSSSETPIQQLAEAAGSMEETDSIVEMLDEAMGAATEIIEGCDLAGMSIVNPHGIDTPAGSGAALRRIDELQFELA